MTTQKTALFTYILGEEELSLLHMLPVKHTVAAYLSLSPTLCEGKPPSPTGPTETTAGLSEKVYQANLLKRLMVAVDNITELQRVTDLSLHLMKNTTQVQGKAMGYLVARECLKLTLATSPVTMKFLWWMLPSHPQA